MNNDNKYVTPLMIAEMLGVENEYLNQLNEEFKNELKNNLIELEMKKTEYDFFNSDFVELPK